MKIGFILGTRPEIIKLYSLIKEADTRKIPYFIVHTNQHYDEKMDKVFFEELELPAVKYNLHVGSSGHGKQTGEMLTRIEEVLMSEAPDIVLVQGDTNTVLAGALAASKLGIKVAHVEAGLRSGDRSMPEEINRIVADHISDYLFCPTDKQAATLAGEGIAADKAFVVGNTVVDAVYACREIAQRRSAILTDLGVEEGGYFLLTCHRPSNTDNENAFAAIIKAVDAIAGGTGKTCVFPVHPRLKSKLEYLKEFKSIQTIDPVGYLDMLRLQEGTEMVFTDSGGIQEEACILEKKCVVLRTNTERPEALEPGGAVLLSRIAKENIEAAYNELSTRTVRWFNPFGDGKAYQKILTVLGF